VFAAVVGLAIAIPTREAALAWAVGSALGIAGMLGALRLLRV
jgi:hypothetical protein